MWRSSCAACVVLFYILVAYSWQGRLARFKLGGRRKRSGEDEVQANIDRAKKRKARREAKAAGGGSGMQLWGGRGLRTSKVAMGGAADDAALSAAPPAAAPEAAAEVAPAAYVSPARPNPTPNPNEPYPQPQPEL